MAMAVAISLGSLILLIFLQNTYAQQCINSVGYKNSAGIPQQTSQKTNCVSSQMIQNGFNPSQQSNIQQMSYQQQPNIQQAPFTQQTSNQQPQLNYQQGNPQQPSNSLSLKLQNQDLASIFSALYNIKQSSQNQRSDNGKGNQPQQMNYELQYLPQNQPNPTFTTSSSMNKPKNSQPHASNSFSETMKFQPAFTFQAASSDNGQHNQQIFTLPVHKINGNDQSQSFAAQNQPVSNSVSNQQTVQSPILLIPSSNTNNLQSQPIVLTLQSPPTQSGPNQLTQSMSQSSRSQPIILAVPQTPTETNQQQKNTDMSNPQQGINGLPMDKQSLMSYVMSQMQSPQGSGNALASVIPAVLNTKSEKSSSMKTILPLILSILNERKSCCGCSHCGCGSNNNHNNEISKSEPTVNTGYANQINYSQQSPVEVLAKMTDFVDKSITPASDDKKPDKPKKVVVIEKSAENSEEDDEGFDSEEDYDEE